jgi:hypothetical protein
LLPTKESKGFSLSVISESISLCCFDLGPPNAPERAKLSMRYLVLASDYDGTLAHDGVVEERVFYFHGANGEMNLRAQKLTTFASLAEGLDEKTWQFHLRTAITPTGSGMP